MFEFEKYEHLIRMNVECCACGGPLEDSNNINLVQLNKRATWKFPVFGQIDIPGYEPRALAVICDECLQDRIEIKRCIEWEWLPYQVKYHDIDGLKDCNSMNQIDYYFGSLFRRKQLLRKAARQESVN